MGSRGGRAGWAVTASTSVLADTAARAAQGWPATPRRGEGGVTSETATISIITNADAYRAWTTIDMAFRMGLASTGVPAHQLVALWPYLAGEAAQIVQASLERAGQAHLLWVAAAKGLARL